MEALDKVYNDFKQGEINSLYAEMYVSMKAFAARYLTDAYALMAEDCVQDAIVNTYNTRDTFTSPFQFKAYLYTCIRNNCITLLRKANSYQNWLDQHENLEEELTAIIIEQETLDLLHKAIDELPEKYRQIFDLSYEQGLKNSEVAQMLGITVEAIDKRKAKMLAILRKKFRHNPTMLILITVLLT